MTLFYLDTSTAVLALFGHSEASSWFDAVTADEDHRVVSSRLLRTELTRVLRREGREVSRRDEVLDHVEGILFTPKVLTIAESIVPHVKTLDAIHLASVIYTGLDFTIATHDETMKRVCAELGYPTYDPVAA